MITNQTVAKERSIERAETNASKAAGLAADVATLTGDKSDVSIAMAELVRKRTDEWRMIASSLETKLPTLAFVGESGAGKTSLIDLLVEKSGPASFPERRVTKRLHWFGPTAPSSLDPSLEECETVATDKMADLGGPYLLLDTPDIGAATSDVRLVLERAFASTKFKVLVLNSRSIAAERWKEEVALGDGSVILPVIHLDAQSTKKYRKAPKSVENQISRELTELKRQMPEAELLDSVFLPDFEATGDLRKAETQCKDLLTAALRSMLSRHKSNVTDRLPELEASWKVFQKDVRNVLAPLMGESLIQNYANLEKIVGDLPGLVVSRLLDEQKKLETLFRGGLRGGLMESIPLWAFPFRPIVGLLCFTTGVWDRLILGVAGSMPSAVATLFSALKNRKEEMEADYSHREQLRLRISRIVSDEIAKPLSEFCDSLARLGDDDMRDITSSIDFELRGEGTLAANWQDRLYEATSDLVERGRRPVFWTAIAGSTIFWLLFLGPLIHTYGQYVPAAWRSLTGQWDPGNLTTYPAMGGGFWLTALILSVIPAFVTALVLVASKLSKEKTELSFEKFKSLIEEDLENGIIALKIEPSAPRIEAYRRIFEQTKGS